MLSKVSFVVGVAVLFSVSCFAAPVAFTYQNYDNTPEDYVTDHLGSVLVNNTTGNNSPFLQLIWVGADGAIDPACNTGDGTTDDDQVFDYYFFEDSFFLYDDGQFTVATTLDDTDAPKNFYIRAWEDPASNYGAGEVPTVLGSYYGDSSIYAWTGANGQIVDAGSWQTTEQSIPEPGTLMLLACGLLTIGASRMRKKK